MNSIGSVFITGIYYMYVYQYADIWGVELVYFVYIFVVKSKRKKIGDRWLNLFWGGLSASLLIFT